MAPVVEALLITVGLLLALWIMTRKPKKFPPGPTRCPVFGYMPILLIGKGAKNITAYLHKKYGKIVGIHVLNIPVIFISGLDEVREALFRDEFAGRPEYLNLSVWRGEKRGIIFSSGEGWKLQRRFALHHLRQLGFGKSSLDGVVHEEMKAVIDGIEEMSGGPENDFLYPVNLHALLGAASVNILWYIVAGKRFDYKTPEFKQLIHAAEVLFGKNTQQIVLYHLLPFLAKILPSSFGVDDVESSYHCIQNYIKREIISHRQAIDYDHPRDFIDIYLCEIEKQKENLHEIFNEPQLEEVCTEFFLAGTDTTANAFSFAILYLILYPEVQKKVQQELDDVVGRERLPSLNDRSRLPYIEATIQEVFRLASVAPVTFPHSVMTTENYVEYRGYHIPKGSWINIDLRGLHHDPEVWKCPDMFIPERFLKKNVNGVQNDVIYPFSAGKRGCPGETLARNNTFLLLSAILQRYSLKVPDGQPQPSAEPDGNTVLHPKPFMVKIQKRF